MAVRSVVGWVKGLGGGVGWDGGWGWEVNVGFGIVWVRREVEYIVRMGVEVLWCG